MRTHGRIVWYKKHLGFGFVSNKATPRAFDAFFHHSELPKGENGRAIAVKKGQKVFYDLSGSANGWYATNISVIS